MTGFWGLSDIGEMKGGLEYKTIHRFKLIGDMVKWSVVLMVSALPAILVNWMFEGSRILRLTNQGCGLSA